MNRASRRAAARAHGSHSLGCGCSELGHYVGTIRCTNLRCQHPQDVDVWMPTSRRVGEASVIYGFCPMCDDAAQGLVPIIELSSGGITG